MDPLKLNAPETVSWSYDEDTDVLYISFDGPRASLNLDLGGGVLARYFKETGEITGLTLVGISRDTKPD